MLRALTLAGSALALSACVDTSALGGDPVRAVSLSRSVTVTAPTGFCADPQVTRPGAGFAFLAACRVLDPSSEIALPTSMALITVQAGAPNSAIVSGSEAAFSDFLTTEQGVALLGMSDIGGPVDVVTTDTDTNRVSVYTRDTSPPDISGSQPESWRLFTDVGDRVVTVTVRGLADRPLSQTASRDLLDRTGDLLQSGIVAGS